MDLEEDWGEHTHRATVSIRLQDYGSTVAAQAAERAWSDRSPAPKLRTAQGRTACCQ